MGRYTIATSTRCSSFPSPRRCRARSSTPSALPWKAGTSRSDRIASGARRVRAVPAAAPWRAPPPLQSLGGPPAQRAVAEALPPHASGRRGTGAVRNRADQRDLVVGTPPARQRGPHMPRGLVGGPFEDLLRADSSVHANAPAAALQGVDPAGLDHREAVRREVEAGRRPPVAHDPTEPTDLEPPHDATEHCGHGRVAAGAVPEPGAAAPPPAGAPRRPPQRAARGAAR